MRSTLAVLSPDFITWLELSTFSSLADAIQAGYRLTRGQRWRVLDEQGRPMLSEVA